MHFFRAIDYLEFVINIVLNNFSICFILLKTLPNFDQKMWGGSQIKNILMMPVPKVVFHHCFQKMIRAGSHRLC